MSEQLLKELAGAWQLPSAWIGGPTPETFRGKVPDRESLLRRPGPQPVNQVAGTYEAQLRRLWEELARLEAGLPQPPPAAEAAQLAAVLFYHREEMLAALRPLVAEIVREVLKGRGDERPKIDHGQVA